MSEPAKPLPLNQRGVTIGVAIGAGVGAALGVALNDLMLGVALGTVIGAAMMFVFSKSKDGASTPRKDG